MLTPRKRSFALAAAMLLALPGCGALRSTEPAPHTPRPIDEAAPAPESALKAYWIGHATVLVRLGDKWIITDPVFSERVGLFVKRHVAAGIDLAGLPPIDWILISHAHMDHLDHRSIESIPIPASIAVPPGVVQHLPPDRAFGRVAALDAWQSIEADGMKITAVPVRHRDDRYFVDGLFASHAHTGWVVEYKNKTVFFAGDTAYDPEIFKEIGRRFRIDLALIPVGPAGQGSFARVFTKSSHVNPEEAMSVFEDVKARWMIPIHHGTFWNAGADEMAEIKRAIRAHKMTKRVLLLAVGESAEL